MLSLITRAGTLPDGLTADGLFDKTMLELSDSVIELGQSDPVPFDWGAECAMYNLDNRQTQADPLPSGQNSGSGSTGTLPLGHGGVQGQRQSGEPKFHVEVGEFVAFATPGNLVESVLVGKVISVGEGDGGHELEMRWYRPSRVNASTRRSTYGKGRWVEEFITLEGKLVPSTGGDHVAAVSAKFSSLTTAGKLPSHVLGALPDNTVGPEGPDEDLGGEEEEDAEEEGEAAGGSMGEEEGEEAEGPGGEGEKDAGEEGEEAGGSMPMQTGSPAVDTQGGEGSSASPALQPVATPAGTHLAAFPNVRITAASHRPRRH